MSARLGMYVSLFFTAGTPRLHGIQDARQGFGFAHCRCDYCPRFVPVKPKQSTCPVLSCCHALFPQFTQVKTSRLSNLHVDLKMVGVPVVSPQHWAKIGGSAPFTPMRLRSFRHRMGS